MERMVKEGYDVVSPIPTCTLMLNEYPRVLGREVPRAHDAMEYLLKLANEGKVQIKGKLEKSVAYHPPCHLKYLRVGYPTGKGVAKVQEVHLYLRDRGGRG